MKNKLPIYHELLQIGVDEMQVLRREHRDMKGGPSRFVVLHDQLIRVWPAFDPRKMRLFYREEE